MIQSGKPMDNADKMRIVVSEVVETADTNKHPERVHQDKQNPDLVANST